MKRIIILLLLVLSLNGCTKIKIIGANFPSLFANQVGRFDIAYGKQPWQKLDVYYPKTARSKKPVIVFFYGGRWQYGSKGDYRFAADAFTERGYVVVIADYVKYPEGKYPQFVQDGAEAVKWTHENIWKYNGDKDKIFVMGHSAGAYIGAMITANKQYGVKSYIKGFAGLAGPYKLKFEGELKEEFDPVFNNPANYASISVPTYMKQKSAPMLFLWGKDDIRINKDQLEIMQNAAKKVGTKTQVKEYDGVDHVGIVAALSQVKRDLAPVVDDVDGFFRGAK